MEDDDPVVSDSESDSEEDDDVKLNEPSKTAVNDKAGLLDKLGDIKWPENAEWIQTLSLDINQDQEINVNDDLNRELAFYTQALEGARQALTKFQSMDLPFLRPSDYYAEMVKTDSHMEKVKGRLLAEKRKVEEAEERRKARESKKLAKEVQAQKLKERAKQKKDDIESVKNWRKQRKQSGFASGDNDGDLSMAFEDGKPFQRSGKKRPGVGPGDRSGGKGKQFGGKGNNKKRKDREHRDSKFGFGGRKGLKKQNTAETTNDFRGFRKGKFSGNKKQKT
ncbi:probable rRNA-processing protein EBP2 homolog isoform X2 [Andrographis paniculata]|nr:probable rRNA-processing protein EBP2 homolog isoform X2 [Andrographis paniculata]